MSEVQKTELRRRAFPGAGQQSQGWEGKHGTCLGKTGSSIWSTRKTSLKTAIKSQVGKDNVINRNIANPFHE